MNNINTQLARYLRYSLWACLYLVLLTPLLIGSKFVFPFISLKTFYFRILVEIALFLYLFLILIDRQYRPRFSKLTLAILVFGLLVLITGLTGVNPYRSFWSTIERGEGSLTISHLIIFCFVLSQVFRNRRQWLSYFSASVLISVLVGFYALAQEYTHISWIVSAGGGRMSSTLGNAAYLGAYALGHFWLSLLLFSERPKLFWRIVASLSAIFELYILWQSETRGALLALVATLPILLIFLIIANRHRRPVRLASFIILFLLIASSLFVWSSRHSEWIKKSNTLNRIANISMADITTQSRLYAWDSSWHGWQERFILGYGWDNYNIAFNKYFHPEIFRDNGSQIWFDRAHNTIFDVAVGSGLVGLLAYLSMFYLCFYYLIKFIFRDRDNALIYLLALVFLLGHFIQNIFVFDCLSTYLMLFMVLAFVCFIVNKHQGLYAEPSTYLVTRPYHYPLALVGLVALIWAISFFNYRPAQANILALSGLQQFYLGQIEPGIDTMHRAIDLHTYQTPEIRQKLADNILGFNKPDYVKDQEQIRKNFTTAFEVIKTNMKDFPLDVQNHLYLMMLYNAASRFDVTLSSQVLRLGEQALALSPTRPQIYFEMGQAAINLGSFKEGVAYFQKGVDLNPVNLDSRWLLLTAKIITGQNKEATAEYEQMRALGLGENAPNLERLANLYSLTKSYPELSLIYQKLIKLNPDNNTYWTSLASVYQASGDQGALNNLLEEFIKLHPGATTTNLIPKP